MKTVTIFTALLFSFSIPQLPSRKLYKTIAGVKVFDIEEKGVYVFRTRFAFDADGAPKAYHKNDAVALDYLANAGKPGNWWALVTDNGEKTGNPIVQTQQDPAPGYYISTTSLFDPSKKLQDTRRYVDSEKIPYVAIPQKFSSMFKKGDLALVVNTKNNLRAFAIFADVSSANEIGEGSIALAKDLRIPGNPKKGGRVADIIYILIKNSGNGRTLTRQQINQIGKSKLTDADITEILNAI